MGVAKGRTQIERGLADMSAQSPAPARATWEPDLTECEEDRYSIPLSDSDRLVIRINSDPQGRLVEFAMMQQTRNGLGQWTEVLRVDTAHAEVHVHRFRRDGPEDREVLLAIERAADVQRGYDLAYEIILSGWNESLGRWRHGG